MSVSCLSCGRKECQDWCPQSYPWEAPPLMDQKMPKWFKDAACKDAEGITVDTFFPGPGDRKTTALAKSICMSCPIRVRCLEWAIDTHQNHGIWGGLTMRERTMVRRASTN